MKAHFAVEHSPRPLTVTPQANVPLAALAWSAMQAQHREWAGAKQALEAEARSFARALASVADEAHRLRRETRTLFASGSGERRAGESLVLAAQRLESALRASGLEVLAPVGEAYDATLMELFENAGTTTSAGVQTPTISEVLAPAVLHAGRVVRLGKATIVLPEQTETNGNA